MNPAQAVRVDTIDEALPALERQRPARTYMGMAWRSFRANPTAMAGLVVVVIMVMLALGAGVISEYVTGHNTYDQDLAASFKKIGEDGYMLGSDAYGRDVATRLVYGARVSLGVAGLSILGAMAIGVTWGVAAGYFGGWIDNALMRVVDILLAIPTLFMLLLIASIWRMGPVALGFIIASLGWQTVARLVRGEVLSLRERDYVEAGRVIGASDWRIMFRYILPNVAPTVIVWAGLTVPGLILWEASLSYLGLGIQQPTPSWGNMLSDAQLVWSYSLTLVFLPGIAIFVTVFAINLVGNGLRDALDPRLSE
jgi:peptide/nickel transport system permease protein